MRYTNPRGFTDLNEFGYIHQPNQIIRKADLDTDFINAENDRYMRGITRRVTYKDDAGVEWYHELRLYVHPTGAGSLTLGSIAWSGAVATFTSAVEGRMITTAGALTGAGAVVDSVMGLLFADYYEHLHDNAEQMEHFHAETLEEGDAIWVIARGVVELDYDGVGAPTAVGDALKTAASGECTKSTAYGVGSLAAVQENIVGPGQKCIGHAGEVVAAAGMLKVKLELPRMYDRPA